MSFDHHGSIHIEESYTLNSTEDMLTHEEHHQITQPKKEKILPINLPTYLRTARVRYQIMSIGI